ncbi:hypothetical protein M5K25_022909 [Dendrobium thyrsiflorum]|uniref:Uncharacterized protein n=1 Tax=Dendrobium thyrsiflorum TaxID=117978 RepID=A0ABD0U748_DENTH
MEQEFGLGFLPREQRGDGIPGASDVAARDGRLGLGVARRREGDGALQTGRSEIGSRACQRQRGVFYSVAAVRMQGDREGGDGVRNLGASCELGEKGDGGGEIAWLANGEGAGAG